MNIKDIVRDNRVRFLRYRQGVAYYAVSVPGEAEDREFPVPLSDIGDATLLAEENRGRAASLSPWRLLSSSRRSTS